MSGEEQSKGDRDAHAPLWGSCRLTLGILLFVGFMHVYALRVNISVAIVCMVNQTAVRQMRNVYAPLMSYNSSNKTRSAGEDVEDMLRMEKLPHDGEFIWSKDFQGLVLASFYYGYIISPLPGGAVAERYGSKVTFAVSMLAASVGTLLTPVAARLSEVFLMATRMLVGLATGTMVPVSAVIWAKWAPSMEKTLLFGFCLSGAMCGNVVAMSVSSVLCDYGFDGGWPSVFYMFGITSCIWNLCYVLLCSESPETHPRISDLERQYIMQNTDSMPQARNQKEAYSTPWLQILFSPAVWAIVLANTCFSWAIFTFITDIPTYMYEDLKYDMQANGLLSALPFIGLSLGLVVLPPIVDKIRAKGIMSTTSIRKLCVLLGSVLPASFLIGIVFVTPKHAPSAVVLLTLGVTSLSIQAIGHSVSPVDIAPRFAGTISGLANTVGTIPGLLVPSIVAAMTREQTHEEWQQVFYMSAGITLLGGVAFSILGTAKLQPWATNTNTLSETTPILNEENATD